MKDKKKHTSLGVLLAFLGTFLFAFKSIFIKLAYAEGLNSETVLMLRMAIALPIYLSILGYLYFSKRDAMKNLNKKIVVRIIGLGAIGYFLASALDLKGLEYISAGLERLTLFTNPIFVALLGALFFSTPLTKRIIVVLITSYLGLWLMFKQEVLLGSNNSDTIRGIILVLCAALSYSFYMLFGKKTISEVGSVLFTAIAMSVSSVFALVLYFLLFDISKIVISPKAWLWMFLLAIVSTVFPSFLISAAIHRISPLQTSVVGMLSPVITIILAVLILSEPFGIYQFLGIGLVVFGVAVLNFKRK